MVSPGLVKNRGPSQPTNRFICPSASASLPRTLTNGLIHTPSRPVSLPPYHPSRKHELDQPRHSLPVLPHDSQRFLLLFTHSTLMASSILAPSSKKHYTLTGRRLYSI
ncbi:hypothetical protein E2C01_091450 [Portunus trituberculatus]|uniref:Uncharacterized protein n=1 Tax=Portunus trituberculatus TaxID=210409 RepID=A0A5B7JPE7_PORTR|nr:hypothetical protein [Portunus trituberculatus]